MPTPPNGAETTPCAAGHAFRGPTVLRRGIVCPSISITGLDTEYWHGLVVYPRIAIITAGVG